MMYYFVASAASLLLALSPTSVDFLASPELSWDLLGIIGAKR